MYITLLLRAINRLTDTESSASNDEQKQKIERPRPRIESLSDLVFGLALSIGAITLVTSPPTTYGAMYVDVLAFGFNFIILISVWMRYTRIMSVLPLENRRTTALNTLLLFCVSIEPFLFNILRLGYYNSVSYELFEKATALYGIDIGLMMLVLGVFTVSLADEEKKLVPKDMIHSLRWEALGWLVSAAIFLVSAAPTLDGVMAAGTSLRIDMWIAALIVTWIRRGMIRLTSSKST